MHTKHAAACPPPPRVSCGPVSLCDCLQLLVRTLFSTLQAVDEPPISAHYLTCVNGASHILYRGTRMYQLICCKECNMLHVSSHLQPLEAGAECEERGQCHPSKGCLWAWPICGVIWHFDCPQNVVSHENCSIHEAHNLPYFLCGRNLKQCNSLHKEDGGERTCCSPPLYR